MYVVSNKLFSAGVPIVDRVTSYLCIRWGITTYTYVLCIYLTSAFYSHRKTGGKRNGFF